MQSLLDQVASISTEQVFARVASVRGLLIEIAGPIHMMSVGSRMSLDRGRHGNTLCEVVGFNEKHALALPFSSIEGIGVGTYAHMESEQNQIFPSEQWLGRVINALGEPVDGKGPLQKGLSPYLLKETPPPAHTRKRVGQPLDLGVKALNCFSTCCHGQRMGIFSGTGVGKSVLLSMLAKNAKCDVAIIGLIGERGREVQEFIQDTLGEEGLKRSIVVVATSDEAALMRRQAAYLTLTLSEFFRDLGQDVLCMIDSVTRFAMAQREIGLSSGEPPTTRGYTPTVFAELPKLLERAGPGSGRGSITGLFTVLVEGDDHNEPVSDAVRGILDGHIVMERAIAERGRYPAINVLKSVSRTMPECVPEQYIPIINETKRLMTTYSDMEELIRLGAYRAGSNVEVDEAIFFHPLFENFLSQNRGEIKNIEQGYEDLAYILQNRTSQFETVEGIEQ